MFRVSPGTARILRACDAEEAFHNALIAWRAFSTQDAGGPRDLIFSLDSFSNR